jgi:hypothetical protein
MGRIQKKNFDAPDEVRRLPDVVGQLVRLGSLTIGRATFEPGWRWSTSAKPIVGTLWCQVQQVAAQNLSAW